MAIDFMPVSEAVEIDQNVRTIMAVRQGSRPLDRGLGIDSTILDSAGTRGQALLAGAIVDELPKQEPRIDVQRVAFAGDAANGQYEPQIEYTINA